MQLGYGHRFGFAMLAAAPKLNRFSRGTIRVKTGDGGHERELGTFLDTLW